MPDEKVKIVFCNVGQGDGALVMQGSRQLLIDVGPDNQKMVACLGRYLPFWDKTIEAIIISHGDDDHDGGLASVERSYRVENLYRDLRKNDVFRLGKIVFEAVHPDDLVGDSNSDSVVGVVNGQILMMGDAPIEVEQKLVWRGLLRQGYGRLGVLKVSHHGSATGTSRELVEAIKPKLAIISVGRNSFGHPSKEVIERLGGVEIRRTDVDGDVVVALE